MELLKDTPLEVAWHVWQARPPHPSLTVVIKGTFTLEDGTCTLASEQALPTGDEHHDDDPERSLRYASDMEPLKPRGECFVVGSFHAPGAHPVPQSKAAFQIGSVRKQIAVFGDRAWERGRMSAPSPVSKVTLSWENAFGGAGIADNPVGRGVGPTMIEGQPRALLPSLEDPMFLIASREDRPRPIGLGPIPRTWPVRARYAGTYGPAWKEHRYPWFPEDIDWRCFNGAPADQQIDGFWRGDEEIVLRHLHPEQPSLRSILPGLRAHAFVVPKATGRPRDVGVQLDTITVDADEGLVYCVWRGVIEVAKEDLADLEHLYVVHDEPGQRRSAESHTASYRNKIAASAEEEQAADAEPIPPTASAVRRAEVIAAAAAIGAPGAKWAHLDQENTIRSDDALESALAHAMAKARAQQNALRPIFENAIGLPEPASVERELTPEEELELAMQSALGDLGSDDPGGRRADLRAAIANGESLGSQDLTGLDLSGFDFAAADLRGAILVRANLSGARFERARLDGAILSEAELSQAIFDGCSLVRADLTGCRARSVRMHDCDLTDAILADAFLREARFSACAFVRADLRESDASSTDFRNCRLDSADLSKATLEGAILRESSLADAWLEGGVKAKRLVLDGCHAPLLRASEEGDFEEASFKKAVLDGARFGGARLRKANFSLAKLSRADFSDAFMIEAVLTGCDLRMARFDRATLMKAAMLKSDLMQARFEGANLRYADLRGANLFQAELYQAKLDDARLDLAHIAGTRLT